jgi:hypothetical protein
VDDILGDALSHDDIGNDETEDVFQHVNSEFFNVGNKKEKGKEVLVAIYSQKR